MRISARYAYPAPPAEVANLFASKGFALRAAEASQAMASEAMVAGSAAGGFTVTVRRTMAADQLPARVRGLLPGGLEIRQAVAWEPPEPDGSRVASVAGEIPGAPVHMAGTAELTPTAQGSQMDFQADVKAAVPLLGHSIEEAAVPAIKRVLDAEHAQALKELANPALTG
ncbi:MAG: DUF2505 domain-containing protein [Bifidobacteriaceae bacterium]|jgi:hypothetical protein|nr:DUF2505 domain-containing protein [Bifidobacteriaceae bacterium]